MPGYFLRYLFYLLQFAAYSLLIACDGMLPLRYAPNPVPAPDIPTGELLLTADELPEGWRTGPCEPNCERSERNGESMRSFVKGKENIPGHVTQYVLYLESEFAASIKFQRYRNTDLSDRPHSVRKPSTAFERPAEISYRSPIADEQYLGCGVDVVPACRAGMRYGNYFVYFYFDLTADYYSDFGIDVDDLSQSEVSAIERDKGGLTLAGVEMVLKAMDKRYTELFDVELPADETE